MTQPNTGVLTELVARAELHFARCSEQLRRADAAYIEARDSGEDLTVQKHAVMTARASLDNAADELADAENALLAARIAEVA